MKTGQHVRVRQASPFAGQYRLDPAVEGVILCHYKVLARGSSSPERVDVQFDAGHIVWGAPVDAFEAVESAHVLETAN